VPFLIFFAFLSLKLKVNLASFTGARIWQPSKARMGEVFGYLGFGDLKKASK
jgi:hypothetical protein